jgi:phage shock protein E
LGVLRALVVVLVGLVLLAAGCGGTKTDSTPPETAAPVAPSRLVSPEVFATAVREPGRVTINVLGPGTVSIPGTDLAIRVDELAARRNELPPIGTGLAVYCAHGNASAAAVQILAGLGYKDIVELDGGMAAWLDSGRKLVSPSS